jgi:uncharacterized protein (DUF1015 family)
MAEIKPFRGVRYNPDQIGAMGAVIAPPYDVISPEMRARLAAAHPENIVRLELPQAEAGRDAYGTAAHLYREWLTSGVLRREAFPALYPYSQTYRLPSGEERARAGVLAVMRLHEYAEGVVLPHEETLPKAKEDRFRLLSAAGAQFSPIFGIYDPGETDVRGWLDTAMQAAPEVDVLDTEQAGRRVQVENAYPEEMEGEAITATRNVRHRLWAATDPVLIQRLADTLAPLPVFIVDGHHRYETALRYRREQGAGAPWAGYVMIYLVAMNDTGLTVLPTHRIVSGLAGMDWAAVRRHLAQAFDFDTRPIQAPADPVRIAEALAGSLPHGTLGMLAPPFERVERLSLRDPEAVRRRIGAGRSEAWRQLDVVALHHLVLADALGIQETRGEASNVTYTRDAIEAVDAVIDQPDRAAFFVTAPTVQDVRQVALAGEKMPEKSTYFWPKAVSGLVIYDQHGMIVG